MSMLNKMKLGYRLGLAFSIVFVLLLSTVATAGWQMHRIASSAHELLNVPLAKERAVSDWYRTIHTSVRRTTAIAKSTDPALAKFFAEDAKASSVLSTELQGRIEKLLEAPKEKEIFEHISKVRKDYIAARDAISKAKTDGNAEEAERILSTTYDAAAKDYLRLLNDLLDEQRKDIDATAKDIDEDYAKSKGLLATISIIAALCSAALVYRVTRSVVGTLGGEPGYAASVARKIAGGDLATPVAVKDGDQRSLLFAMQDMRNALSKIVSQVRSGTEMITTGAAEIAVGTHDLSSRTEQQAASIEETAAAMEQLTSTVKQNADNSRQGNQLAATASAIAVQGGEVVEHVVATMADINDSAKKIADIIGVIDGIAFQTNILALNAAVEAARAGEQGRGFAVVASEVRTLAQRSASAAKEIKELINTSVEKVDNGAKQVARAGETMTQIVDAVRKVTDIMNEISSASNEQRAGIESVNDAITKMEQSTQQNAAMAEQSAAATQTLREQADALAQLVGVFKL